MPDVYLSRPCPTCDSAWHASAAMASAPPAESLPFDELRSCWRGFFRDHKPFFTYVRCPACGQLFSPRYFRPAQLAELYGQMDDNTGGQDETLMARTQAGYWRLLRKAARLPHGDYLELGPDIGLFTRAAATAPALGKFWLVEPNRAVHGKLAQAAGAKPHVLLEELAAVERIPDGSLAFAVAIHVLDHLLEPQPLLDRIVRKLAPGGRVLAVTHNERSLAARCFGARWPAFCLQHPQLYAPATLRGSFQRAGLRDVRIARTTNYFPLRYLLRHGFFAAGLGEVNVPLPFSWNIGLKLGNIAGIGVRA